MAESEEKASVVESKSKLINPSNYWILLTVLLIVILAVFFYLISVGRDKGYEEDVARPLSIERIDDKGNPLPGIAGIPEPASIARCNKGPFPEGPGISVLSHERGWAFGIVQERFDNEKMTVRVKQIYDDSMVDVDLFDVDTIEYREVLDRESYLKGYVDSFRHIKFKSGEPYTIKDYYPYIPVGAHVYVPEDKNIGKYFQIYCDSEQI